MTLNISPETKIGKIENWDAEKYIKGGEDSYRLIGKDGDIYDYSKQELEEVIKDSNLGVAANGVLYIQDKPGLIADILNTWFNKRVEYRKLEKKYGEAGDTEKYDFYAKRQLVQKILLNSMYGCLGLPAFRFYDRDNAEAVTITGQIVIKKTADMANIKYNKELGGIPILIELEDDSVREYYPNTIVNVKRDGSIQQILAKQLIEDDDLIV
jgi:DNA polymerase elongation subunit (family B)